MLVEAVTSRKNWERYQNFVKFASRGAHAQLGEKSLNIWRK